MVGKGGHWSRERVFLERESLELGEGAKIRGKSA